MLVMPRFALFYTPFLLRIHAMPAKLAAPALQGFTLFGHWTIVSVQVKLAKLDLAVSDHCQRTGIT